MFTLTSSALDISGIVVVLFFQCMAALLVPVRPADGGTKWTLVAHTVAMFSFVTIYTATELNIQSLSYIDNREFPGIDGSLPPGPIGYQYLTYFEAANVIRNLTFILNNWLADALLVRPAPNSIPRVSDVTHSSSSIVVMSSIP